MAKSSRGRLRVFFAEFDGDDETIQEGLRAIGVAVNKTFQPQRVVKYLPAGNGSESLEGLEGEIVDEASDDDEVIDVSPKPRSSKTKRKPPTMTLVKDLNLRPNEGKNMREFYAEKCPKTQLEQVAVCVYYLRRVLELDGVTAHHVYTCLKDVDTRVPNDLPQIIRNTANKKGWVDANKPDAIDITMRGENFVEHDLPDSGGNGSSE